MKTINTVSQRTKSNGRGQVMIEFALVLPIILLIALGIMDLARAVYAYGVISNAARDGARWGSVDATNTAAIMEKTKAKTTGLEKDRIMIGVQCIPNTGPDQPYPNDIENACGSWNFLTVSVWYQFQPITLFFVSFQMYTESTMTIE